MKRILITISFLLTLLINSTHTFAQEKASGSSAQLAAISHESTTDTRVAALKAYLESHNSPLAPYAAVFVYQADKYNLPWDMVAAISGVESQFANSEPCINAWGWGIYGTQTLCFDSYQEGIVTVTEQLRDKFMDQWGDSDIYQIGHHYASSQAWPGHVVYFMNDIENFKKQFDANQISISI